MILSSYPAVGDRELKSVAAGDDSRLFTIADMRDTSREIAVFAPFIEDANQYSSTKRLELYCIIDAVITHCNLRLLVGSFGSVSLVGLLWAIGLDGWHLW